MLRGSKCNIGSFTCRLGCQRILDGPDDVEMDTEQTLDAAKSDKSALLFC